MSSTGRGARRQENDWYQTPAPVVRAILPYVKLGKDVLDPCAGEGAILREIRTVSAILKAGEIPKPKPHLRGIELDADRAQACGGAGFHIVRRDALAAGTWGPRPGSS